MKLSLLLSVWPGLLLPAAAATLYVSPAGSDSNAGSRTAPFLTIQRAANVVKPGDTVIVRDGIYSNPAARGTGSKLISISRSGTAGAYISFVAEHPLAAIIDGGNNNTAEGWSFAGSYVRVQGFEVRRFSDTAFSNYGGGSFITIAQNDIHDIGRYCTTTGIGRDGIFLSHDNVIVEQNRIHDIGRHAPGENGCVNSRYHQTNDHGIYISGANNVTIRNNVFYRNVHGWSVHVYPSGVSNLSVLNNTFVFGNAYRNSGFIIFDNASGGSRNFRIANNIAYSPHQNFVHFYNTSGYTGIIANNLTFNGTVSDASPSGVSITGNLDNANPLLAAAGSSVVGSLTSPDPHLTAGSPAIGRGMTLADVTNDFAGNARQGAAYDIGAFKFVAAPATLRN